LLAVISRTFLEEGNFLWKQGDKVNILQETEELIIEQAMPGQIRNIKQPDIKKCYGRIILIWFKKLLDGMYVNITPRPSFRKLVTSTCNSLPMSPTFLYNKVLPDVCTK
jgi:hypothetical protein